MSQPSREAAKRRTPNDLQPISVSTLWYVVGTHRPCDGLRDVACISSGIARGWLSSAVAFSYAYIDNREEWNNSVTNKG